jgi:hydroxymethylbilane synthase
VTPLKIGTRGSALALWQARAVATQLERLGASARIVTITTRGDRRQDAPLTSIGGKGVFVKEIHDALLGGAIDLAVHSAKDMAAVCPPGLGIGAVLPREDPRDAFVLPRRDDLDEIAMRDRPGVHGHSPLFGTGSPRRVAQLRRLYPAARFEPIRGNVDTRLGKLDAGQVDALVLACAGLRRLGLEDRITDAVPVDQCVPAPGQGIIAVEARTSDESTMRLLEMLNDPMARTALEAEQAVVEELGGGCQLPLGVFAEIQDGTLSIRAFASSMNGVSFLEGCITGDAAGARETGRRLARELASRGARELLQP